MADERWDRLRSIVERAVELPAAEREALLDAECRGDAELRDEAAEWLEAAVDDDPFLEPPERASREGPLSIGDAVGPYRLTGVIASGGMGTVYEAEQETPRRRVALKMMKTGPWSPASERRFRYEVEVLAALRHPGVAQVYETGVHSADDGDVPWFAMEFVEEAETIVEHARVHDLSLEERVRLFVRACDAVQHGHRKGVIHRDLKPDNILVGREGRPKVIDFGVARATGTEFDARTIQTRTGEIVGTLAYMSPEQLSGDASALDTRSDVYALGVVLYELLCGELPYGSERRDLVSTARVITETPARRPSLVRRELRGDLETILLKCLEKDPDRRYPSADDLGADLNRWLDHAPIAARPPSLLYTLSMLARRHRGAALGVAATFVALIVGTIVSIRFAIDADEQRLKADEGRRAAELAAYVASIAAVDASIEARQVGEAQFRLHQAAEEYRSWEWHHLARRSDASRVSYSWKGHHAFAVAFDSTGRRLASVAMSNDGKSKVRIFEGDRLLLELPPSAGPTRAIAFCPGDELIALGRPDGRIELFAIATGERSRVLGDAASKDAIRTLAFSADGAKLISGTNGGNVRSWDWRNGSALGTQSVPGGRVVAASEFVSVTRSGTIATPEGARPVGATIAAAAVTRDGALVAFAAPDFSVRLWDVRTGAVVAVLSGHSGPVQALAFSPDGRRLVSGAQDATVRIWDVEERRAIATLLGHTTMVFGVAFSADGTSVASAAANGDTKIWVAGPRETIPTLGTARAWTIAFDPTGATLASGDIDGTLRLWDVRTRRETAVIDGAAGIHALSFDAAGEEVAVGRDDGTVHVFRRDSRRTRLTIDTGQGSIWAVLFTGDRLLTAGDDGTIRSWDSRDGTALATWSGHTERVRALAASSDGRRVASASVDTTVRLWDAGTGETRAILEGHTRKVVSLAFSPDGTRLASGGFDIKVRLWDLESNRELGQFEGSFVAGFSADGQRLLAGGGTAIRMWHVATGRPVATLRGHRKIIIQSVMSADGSTVASLDRDIASDLRSAKLWETNGGTQTVTVE